MCELVHVRVWRIQDACCFWGSLFLKHVTNCAPRRHSRESHVRSLLSSKMHSIVLCLDMRHWDQRISKQWPLTHMCSACKSTHSKTDVTTKSQLNNLFQMLFQNIHKKWSAMQAHIKETTKWQTMLASHAPTLLPCDSEWQGCGIVKFEFSKPLFAQNEPLLVTLLSHATRRKKHWQGAAMLLRNNFLKLHCFCNAPLCGSFSTLQSTKLKTSWSICQLHKCMCLRHGNVLTCCVKQISLSHFPLWNEQRKCMWFCWAHKTKPSSKNEPSKLAAELNVSFASQVNIFQAKDHHHQAGSNKLVLSSIRDRQDKKSAELSMLLFHPRLPKVVRFVKICYWHPCVTGSCFLKTLTTTEARGLHPFFLSKGFPKMWQWCNQWVFKIPSKLKRGVLFPKMGQPTQCMKSTL